MAGGPGRLLHGGGVPQRPHCEHAPRRERVVPQCDHDSCGRGRHCCVVNYHGSLLVEVRIFQHYLGKNNTAACDNMSFFSYFHSVNKGTIPRFITGKKLDIWDNSLYYSYEQMTLSLDF